MKLLQCGLLTYIGVQVAFAACGGQFKELSGIFKSPKFPNNYPNKKRCVYRFNTGFPITITCTAFNLQSANKNDKCLDFMQIVDSGTKTKYCGTDGPVKYTSTAKKPRIIFKSNKSQRKKGFRCKYVSVVPDMMQTALDQHSSNTCTNSEQRNCGCSVTKDDAEYYRAISGNERIVVSNAIPSHDYETGQDNPNPNKACPHKVYMAVPLNPSKGDDFNPYGLGPVGIAISGGFFYNHVASPQGDVAVVAEGPSFDTCQGHSDPNCRYHYHMLPTCIAGNGECKFVGHMRDGFSVYTYCSHETESRFLKSCYFLTSGDGSSTSHYTYNQTAYNNGECDLDMANGYTFSGSKGYGYVFTEDYPFIMAGYYGTVLSDMCYLE